MTRSYMGVELTLSIEDPLAQARYLDGANESYPEIVAARRRGLSPGATVFDLGAHQAVVALILPHIVGRTGKVVAGEAVRHNARVAAATCKSTRPLTLSCWRPLVRTGPEW